MNYDDMTLKQLKDECKKYNIMGYSKLKKKELVTLLKNPSSKILKGKKESKEKKKKEKTQRELLEDLLNDINRKYMKYNVHMNIFLLPEGYKSRIGIHLSNFLELELGRKPTESEQYNLGHSYYKTYKSAINDIISRSNKIKVL